jgi:hypothetical protein
VRTFRILMGTLTAICLLPILSAIGAILIALALGPECQLKIGANGCLILGQDFAGILRAVNIVGVFFWFKTKLYLIIILFVWAGVESVHAAKN